MEYPECEKLAKRQDERINILNFLEWCRREKLIDLDTRVSDDELIIEYFGIDIDKLERERRHILEGQIIQNDHR